MRLPAPPRPKGRLLGWVGAGSWRVKGGLNMVIVVVVVVEVW